MYVGTLLEVYSYTLPLLFFIAIFENPNWAKQETIDLSKFLYMVDSTKCRIRHVTHTANIVTYLNRLRDSHVGLSGQITKLTTINHHALSMMFIQIPDDGGSEEDKTLVVRVKVVETKINGMKKVLRKKHAIIHAKKRDLCTTDGGDQEAVLKFLGNPQLLTLVTTHVAKEVIAEQEQLLTRRFLMCSLLYRNAQRQGSICNMKLEEQARQRFIQTFWQGGAK